MIKSITLNEWLSHTLGRKRHTLWLNVFWLSRTLPSALTLCQVSTSRGQPRLPVLSPDSAVRWPLASQASETIPHFQKVPAQIWRRQLFCHKRMFTKKKNLVLLFHKVKGILIPKKEVGHNFKEKTCNYTEQSLFYISPHCPLPLPLTANWWELSHRPVLGTIASVKFQARACNCRGRSCPSSIAEGHFHSNYHPLTSPWLITLCSCDLSCIGEQENCLNVQKYSNRTTPSPLGGTKISIAEYNRKADLAWTAQHTSKSHRFSQLWSWHTVYLPSRSLPPGWSSDSFLPRQSSWHHRPSVAWPLPVCPGLGLTVVWLLADSGVRLSPARNPCSCCLLSGPQAPLLRGSGRPSHRGGTLGRHPVLWRCPLGFVSGAYITQRLATARTGSAQSGARGSHAFRFVLPRPSTCLV